MYCRNCGSEIPDEAKFCTFCGTETVSPKNQEQKNDEGQKPSEAADQAASSASTEQVGSLAEASSQTPSNLKAAVESNKKRSRRRMPMILLVALALALATSVAYAAYRVYTDVWMPMQQEQQQKAQAEKDAQEAQDAYDGIIKEYSEALAANTSSMSDAEELTSSYPHTNPELVFTKGLYSGEIDNCRYALKDINNDGVPELLIGEIGGGTVANNVIWDMWTYQDGELKRLQMGMRNMYFSLRQDGLVLTAGRSGVNIVGFSIDSLNNSALHDCEDEWENAKSNWSSVASLSEDRIEYHGSNQTSYDTNTVYYEEKQGDSTVNSGYCTTDQFISMRDEFLSKYPEDTSVEWKTISTE